MPNEPNDLQLPLVETFPILEVFSTGLAPIEYCDEFVRLIFYADHTAPDGDEAFGNRERIIVARLVMPARAFHGLVRRLISAPKLMS